MNKEVSLFVKKPRGYRNISIYETYNPRFKFEENCPSIDNFRTINQIKTGGDRIPSLTHKLSRKTLIQSTIQPFRVEF